MKGKKVKSMKDKIYPPFSVLISVYKNEDPKYLDEALKSIENQTVCPSEIVLVEDGPIPIELKKVIAKHQETFGKGFKDIISKKNRGLGAALRLGTKYVSTNWIARMDSDDISVPQRFEMQLEQISKNPKLAVIGGQVQEFACSTSNVVGYRKVPTSEALLRQFIKWRSPFNHPSVIINKTVLLKVGGYVPYGNLEDYYLWTRIIIANYHIHNIDKVLVKMRVDKGMYSRRGKISNIRYFFHLRRFMYKNNLIKKQEQIVGNLLMFLNIIMPTWIRKLIYRKVLHK